MPPSGVPAHAIPAHRGGGYVPSTLWFPAAQFGHAAITPQLNRAEKTTSGHSGRPTGW